MKSSKVIVATWAGALVIITYRTFHNGQGMPPPRSLFAANIVWSLLSLLSLANQEFANVLSVGTLLGLVVTDSSILAAAKTSVASPATNASPAIGNVVAQTNSAPPLAGGYTY